MLQWPWIIQLLQDSRQMWCLLCGHRCKFELCSGRYVIKAVGHCRWVIEENSNRTLKFERSCLQNKGSHSTLFISFHTTHHNAISIDIYLYIYMIYIYICIYWPSGQAALFTTLNIRYVGGFGKGPIGWVHSSPVTVISHCFLLTWDACTFVLPPWCWALQRSDDGPYLSQVLHCACGWCSSKISQWFQDGAVLKGWQRRL